MNLFIFILGRIDTLNMVKYIITILVINIFSSCYYDHKEELYPVDLTNVCDTTTVTYNTNVIVIMANSCAVSGCHDVITKAGNPPLDLSNYNDVNAFGLNGQLMGRMKRSTGASGAMPLGSQKLSDCQIAQLDAWINAGALNN